MKTPWDALDKFAGPEFSAEKPGGDGQPRKEFLPGIDTLPPGDYVLTINAAAQDTAKTRNGDKALVRLTLGTEDGRQVEHAYWLDSQTALNIFAADMVVLGFPVADWHAAGKLPSQWVPDVVRGLVGIRFKARRKDSPGQNGGQVFHRLYVNQSLGYAAPTPPMPGDTQNDDDIPF